MFLKENIIKTIPLDILLWVQNVLTYPVNMFLVLWLPVYEKRKMGYKIFAYHQDREMIQFGITSSQKNFAELVTLSVS